MLPIVGRLLIYVTGSAITGGKLLNWVLPPLLTSELAIDAFKEAAKYRILWPKMIATTENLGANITHESGEYLLSENNAED